MPRFVIHLHNAVKAGPHHDLRLEADGVYKSWAVPKFVSEDIGVKRLAVEVEDHSLEYGEFEGKIPDGQYGAGEVTIWDKGEYKTKLRDYKKWELEFTGEKLRGLYVLVKMRPKQWLIWKSTNNEKA